MPDEFRAAACAAASWGAVRRRLPTVEARETAAAEGLETVPATWAGGRVVLLLDGLDRAAPATAALLTRLQRAATVVGAVRSVPPAGSLRTFFLTFGRLDVPPLDPENTRTLAARLVLAHDVCAADPRHLAREAVRRSHGNPAALRAVLHDAAGERLVSDQSVRDLQTRDDAPFFNAGLLYAPLLVVGGLVRVLMIGVSNTDLYVLVTLVAVAGYLVFRVFRPFFAWQPTPETR